MEKSRVHFMGVGGQGISAVAQMAHMNGEQVTGCDRQESATVAAVRAAGIPVTIGHHAEHLDDVDTLVISPAVTALDPHNPELVAAGERGIQVKTWQELLGSLMSDKCTVAVAGVHGKSTTTSMLSLILTNAGLDPTCVIGAVVPQLKANYRIGQNSYFVVEADEYNHNFWHYHPRLAIIKAIEFEHPEFFANYEACLAAFEHFVRGMDMHGDWPFPPTLLINGDDEGCLQLRARLTDWPGRILTYSVGAALSLGEAADYEAYDIKLDGETSFRLRSRVGESFPEDRIVSLQLPGIHNIDNATTALAAAHCLGIAAETAITTLEQFVGTRRRFDIRHRGSLLLAGEQHDVILVDDYAHHPTAIATTLEATRRRYPERRLVAVYQPHMFSRTRIFFNQFLSAFDQADIAIIADIYPAREQDTGLIHARDLVTALEKRPYFADGRGKIYHGGSVYDTVRLLTDILRSGDLAVIMGAGDIYIVAEQLLRNAGQA